MRKTSYRNHHYAEWLYTTRGLTLAQQGALHRLIDESWNRWNAATEPHPSLPDDDGKLKELLGESSKNWQRLRIRAEVLDVYFERVDGRLVHPGSRMAAERIVKHFKRKAETGTKRPDSDRAPKQHDSVMMLKLQGKTFDAPEKVRAAMLDKTAFTEGKATFWQVPPKGKGKAKKQTFNLAWDNVKGWKMTPVSDPVNN